MRGSISNINEDRAVRMDLLNSAANFVLVLSEFTPLPGAGGGWRPHNLNYFFLNSYFGKININQYNAYILGCKFHVTTF